MVRKGWELFFLGLSFVSLVWGGDVSPKKVIRNFEKKLNSAKTVRVDFQETYIWKLTGEEQSLRGELLLEGENRFRVTTEDQIIVSDGETLWTYSKPSHRVLIDRLTTSDDALLPRRILFRYTEDYHVRLGGEEEISGNPCYVLIFTAETGDVIIPQVKVWIDKREWVPRKVEQTDLSENRTVYLLYDIQVDFPLDKEIFHFTIPDGAEIIDMK